jgi:hypothetical protein
LAKEASVEKRRKREREANKETGYRAARSKAKGGTEGARERVWGTK